MSDSQSSESLPECGVPDAQVVEPTIDWQIIALLNNDPDNRFARVEFILSMIEDLQDIKGIQDIDDMTERLQTILKMSQDKCLVSHTISDEPDEDGEASESVDMLTMVHTFVNPGNLAVQKMLDVDRITSFSGLVLMPLLKAYVGTERKIGTDGILQVVGATITTRTDRNPVTTFVYYEPTVSLASAINDGIAPSTAYDSFLYTINLLWTVYRAYRDIGVIFQNINENNVGLVPYAGGRWILPDQLFKQERYALEMPITNFNVARIIPDQYAFVSRPTVGMPPHPDFMEFYQNVLAYHEKDRGAKGNLPAVFEGKIAYVSELSFLNIYHITDTRLAVDNRRYPKKSVMQELEGVENIRTQAVNHLYLPPPLWDVIDALSVFSDNRDIPQSDLYSEWRENVLRYIWKMLPKTAVEGVFVQYEFFEEKFQVYKVESARWTTENTAKVLRKAVKGYLAIMEELGN